MTPRSSSAPRRLARAFHSHGLRFDASQPAPYDCLPCCSTYSCCSPSCRSSSSRSSIWLGGQTVWWLPVLLGDRRRRRRRAPLAVARSAHARAHPGGNGRRPHARRRDGRRPVDLLRRRTLDHARHDHRLRRLRAVDPADPRRREALRQGLVHAPRPSPHRRLLSQRCAADEPADRRSRSSESTKSSTPA